MSQSRNQKALNEVATTFRLLQEDLERFGAGERYWRSWDRSKLWVSAALKAQSYMELAMEAMGEPARLAEAADPPTGWLSRKVRRLSQYLSSSASLSDGEEYLVAAAEVSQAPSIQPSAGDHCFLRGNGAVVELPDLIGMIRGQGMTGVLDVAMPSEAAKLHFQGGQLVHAFSENAPDGLRLGEILVDQGSISRERLDSLLFCHQDSPHMLGETLLKGNLVSSEQLQSALTYQIQSLFDRIFEHRKEAQFCFEPGLPETEAPRAQVNVMQLLLDSARAYDERQAG
ncbi:MAG: DUF4388 domain-containing protein [Planctomycetes bacterium]|nr:DUF4388 domain-containing protein [Planctomycetota bacterium]